MSPLLNVYLLPQVLSIYQIVFLTDNRPLPTEMEFVEENNQEVWGEILPGTY